MVLYPATVMHKELYELARKELRTHFEIEEDLGVDEDPFGDAEPVSVVDILMERVSVYERNSHPGVEFSVHVGLPELNLKVIRKRSSLADAEETALRHMRTRVEEYLHDHPDYVPREV